MITARELAVGAFGLGSWCFWY